MIDLTKEEFDRLLAWLDRDMQKAGERYEAIRATLIKIAACRGCSNPEDLADLTIDRVMQKLPGIQANYVGDPGPYFSSVLRFIILENQRTAIQSSEAAYQATNGAPHDNENAERAYDCLGKCISRLLTPAKQALIIDYYGGDRRTAVEDRKRLAQRMGITRNALRVRADRIRASLEGCLAACLERRGCKKMMQ